MELQAVMPRRIIALNQLKEGQAIELDEGDVFLFDTDDIKQFVKDATHVGRLEPKGLVVEFWPMELRGEKLIAARALCLDMPEHFCKVVLSTSADPNRKQTIHSFRCSCDFDQPHPDAPICQLMMNGKEFWCEDNGCGKIISYCQLQQSRAGRFTLAMSCACVTREKEAQAQPAAD